METRGIVVIGASAGGVEALRCIVEALPDGFPAAVFVVVHFPPHASSSLPAILSRAGTLPAVHPEDGDPIEPGRIYVAPPDLHLLVERGRIRLSRGPRENGHRPAVDPLFRSAAVAYGRRVVGVVLTGNLDDGTGGLSAVVRRGGVAVVQDPADAAHPGMPSSALANVRVDHSVPLAGIPALLARLVTEPVPDGDRPEVGRDLLRFETDITEMEPYALHADQRPGEPSGYSCPECQGVLFEVREGELARYRCRVGHAYGPESLMAQQADQVEEALWIAFQSLKERAAFARVMARKMEVRRNQYSHQRFMEQAAEADARAAVIRDVLRGAARGAPNPSSEEEPPLRRAGGEGD
ncbi:MAG TPA: chemotaxis protein CheB [Longimicrobium sp.]|nr:chemotaxis protein CheB [Longimicrobium sp.]